MMDILHGARAKLAIAATAYHKLRHNRPVEDDELLDSIDAFGEIVDYPEISDIIAKMKAVITVEAKKRKLL